MAACSPKTTPVKKTPSTSEKEHKDSEGESAKEKKEKPPMVVSLVLPFELDLINYKTVQLKDLSKAELALDFYQGYKMAIDSIASRYPAKFKFQIYDSKDNVSQANVLASKLGIINSDLIVGPVFPNGISAFSVHSKAMKKLMVSPLAAASADTFNNPYLISINNSLEQHVDKAVSFIRQNLKPKNVVLIRSGQADEYKYAVPFKKAIQQNPYISFSEIGIKAVGYENVFKSLTPVGLNVIVLPSTDRNFLLSISRELEKLTSNFQIAVIGHPSWEKLQFLEANTMQNINAYITSSSKIDYKDARADEFVKQYRKKFTLEPSEYAFKGFDIGYFFSKLMAEKGKDFSNYLTKEKYNGLHNNIHLAKDAQYGYYNKELLILKYSDFQLKKVD
ncbi:ABC transporter substrate-binding protein [Pseudopedobacter beijingensis]|uniref:ABC transporter substrate-binding protein n=1 Tax=Pseudopedobacter beijingensis TaxID=1207056 RepID=A0ABW4IFM1_9SPHI